MMLMLLGCLQETKSPNTFDVDYPSDVEEEQTDDSDTGETEDTASPSEEEQELSCDEGFELFEFCTGIALSESHTCTETLYNELELMQYLSCETFLTAQEELPLCESLGLNCPENYDGCATEPLNVKEVLSVLEWTDTSTLTSIDDVAYRNESLRYMFADHGDIRGAFASVYSPITDAAVDAIDAGEFVNEEWVRELVIDFAARYYENLRASMLAQSTTQSWGRYYGLSDNCDVAGLRIAVFGIAVHLIVDLPHSLAEISTTSRYKEDYDQFGLKLIEANPLLIQNLRDDYGIESENFLNGFFLGDWIDSVAGDDATTTFAFQTIRNKAWENGMWLQGWRRTWAEGDIYTSWRSADVALATWDIFQ